MANLGRPEGEVAHAVVAVTEGVVAVAEGVVQGASAVAEGVATVMATCHGEEYTRMEEPTQASSPPPYFVSVVPSVCFTTHQLSCSI